MSIQQIKKVVLMIAKAKHIEDSKGLMGLLPTINARSPKRVYLATDNARCSRYELFINEGDNVKIGQVIGMRHSSFFDQPIHSTVSGTYIGKEKHYHRSGKLVDFLVIENDFKDEWDPSIKERSDEEVKSLSKDEITKILKDTAMVGLGGSSFPTYIKFQTNNPINTVLINGIECEPYITADHRLMLEDLEGVIRGIIIIQRAFNCKKALICVKSKYKDLIEVYSSFLKRIPEYGISVCPVKNYYPQGWEVAMIKEATGIRVPSGHLPSEYGIINFNVSTAQGIFQAVKYNRPVIDRFVSVNGDGINFPSNFKIRIGTHVSELIDYCGGYKDENKDKVFILGGPMMGASLPSSDCIVTKTVTSIIVLNRNEVKEENCIRCGSCILSCPTKLEPVQIMNAVKAMDKKRIKNFHPERCIECGLCTYACTSKIRVTDFIRRAKIIAKLP